MHLETTARARRSLLAVLAATALAAGACASDDTTDTGAEGDTTNEGSIAPGSWTTFGYDLANSRFNPDEAMLTSGNVDDLEVSWEAEDVGDVTSTPAVVDGVVYFGDWDGVLHAVDAVDGSEVWRTPLEGGQIMSSAAVTDDAVVAATNSGLARVDRSSGEIEWSVQTSEHPIAIAPVAPVVVDDVVLHGVASGELMLDVEEYSFVGSVAAFDLASGDVLWETPFTSADEEEGAGVGIWSNPAVDRERGLVFVGTGNTYEPPQAELSNSVVALDLDDGSVAWATQFTDPDVWSMGHPGGLDADVGAGPNLWGIDDRDVVGAGDKRGDYYALDRDTGEVVWMADMTEGSILGGVIGTSAHGDGRIYVGSNVGDPETNSPTGSAAVVALDDQDGSILWETEIEGSIYAPVTAIPGVVFVGTTAGMFHAFDAESGDELWNMEVPDQVGSGASVVDGIVYWGVGFALFGAGTGEGGLYALSVGDTAAPDGESAAPVEDHDGAEIFRNRCASCHGAEGQGAIGPSLAGVAERLDRDEQIDLVREGRGAQMPAFGDALDDNEINAVVNYTRDEL